MWGISSILEVITQVYMETILSYPASLFGGSLKWLIDFSYFFAGLIEKNKFNGKYCSHKIGSEGAIPPVS